MWSAGTTYGTPPLRLSLQSPGHHLNNFISELLAAPNAKHQQIYRILLKVITHKAVSDRLVITSNRYQLLKPYHCTGQDKHYYYHTLHFPAAASCEFVEHFLVY